DGLSELKPFLTILECVLVGAHGASRRLPANHEARHLQNASRVAERLVFLQPVRFRYSAVLHRDQSVLDHFERNLVLNFLDFEARCGLVLDDERFDLVVRYVTRPNNRNVAPGSVSDPFLLTIEDPGFAIPLGSGQHSARSSGSNQWFRQAEAADLFPASHRRGPFLFFFFLPAPGDRTPPQTSVAAQES